MTGTHAKLEKRMRQIDECIERYLRGMDTADRQAPDIAEARTTRLKEKIVTLKSQMLRLREVQITLENSPAGQVSLTDPDARAMATSNSRGLVGYHVQTAVEPEHHLMVAHEVTNTGIDRRLLSRIAQKAKVAIGAEQLTAIADRGYYSGGEIIACEAAGITPIVSKPMTSSARFAGRFDKEDFVFDAATNEYRCPAGSRLKWRFARVEDGQLLNRYWSSDCPRCAIKAKCTPSDYRRVSRSEHEASLEAMQQGIDKQPQAMRIRRQTVEHPFGTIKDWMGATHFLTRSLEHVSTEMSLHVLAYNFKRVMKILGIETLMAAMQA